MNLPAPAWLNETAELVNLLTQFIDKLDKQSASERARPVGISLNDKTMPQLFKLGEEADHLWDLINSLKDDHSVLHIKLKKQRDPFSPEYYQAWLTLQQGGEEIARHWLQRPEGLLPLQSWRKAVAASQHRFPGNTEKLYNRRIAVQGIQDDTVVAAFVAIEIYQHWELTLRQLSSRCFWSDSKFLDKREELVRELYPDLRITARPVMVNIFIPAIINGILFIENQDSYTSAVAGNPAICKNHILVYTAGFMGSASRIRQRDGVSLHYHRGSEEAKNQLETWWFDNCPSDWPVWFWGDLDYSGMEILKVMKQRFTEINAWPLGYEPMLPLLQQHKGHLALMADRQVQRDPGVTGCEFTDNVLLPNLHQTKTFVHQEVVFDETAQGHKKSR